MTRSILAGMLLIGMLSVAQLVTLHTAQAATGEKLVPHLSGEVPYAPVTATALGLKDSHNSWHCYTGTGSVPGASAPTLPGTGAITEVCAGSHNVTVTYTTFLGDTGHSFFGPGNCDNFDPNPNDTNASIVALVEAS